MKPPLVESMAWRALARDRIETPERYEKSGLCFQVMQLRDRGLITTTMAKWMLTRIMLHVPLHDGRETMHAYHHRERRAETNEGRALAALWFSLDAADEESNS